MSEIRATTISDAAGTGPITLTGQSAAKAWVTFGDSGTASIAASFNVASITDADNANYRTNFTSSMSSSHYVVNANGVQGSYDMALEARSTASTYAEVWLSVGGADQNNASEEIGVAIHGDLA